MKYLDAVRLLAHDIHVMIAQKKCLERQGNLTRQLEHLPYSCAIELGWEY